MNKSLKIYPKSKLNINNEISTENTNSIQSDSIQSDSIQNSRTVRDNIYKFSNCTIKFVKNIKTIIMFRNIVGIVDTKK